ncbi:hypothetical protein IFR05_002551 [Cadophora sp. M221]|nr:hypothetical protein IFR05_002551 [Cadophora sp. M221]
MGATDLAGVIGTRVAAGLGIIALVGIIGPILVWRASRTDRHKALDALENTNTDFISKGYKAGPNIRLDRIIKAPMLNTEPRQMIRNFVWNAASKRAAVESLSWVKLGLVLKAYGLDYHFAQLGACGAYVNSLGRDRPLTPGWMASRLKWARHRGGSTYGESLSDGQHNWNPLHGLAATLYMLSGSSRRHRQGKEESFLNLHSIEETGDLPQYPIPLSHLFWLAVGCIPTSQGRVFSLNNVADLAAAPQPETEVDYSGPVTPQSPLVGGRGVHFDEGESNDNDDPYRYQYGTSEYQISPNNFITSTTPPTPSSHVDPYQSRGFYLRKTADHNPALEGIAQVVNARFNDVYSINEIEATEDMTAEFKAIAGATYVPSESPYVRLTPGDPVHSRYSGSWFLLRKDAQILAQAILSLPLYCEGYLLGSQTSNARTMLCDAAEALPQLLGRMIQSKAALGLETADKENILSALQQMYMRTLKYDKTRLNSRSIFNLDHALLACLHSNPKVNLAIGVLVITNADSAQ